MSDLVAMAVAIIAIVPATLSAVFSYLNGRRQVAQHIETKAAIEVVREDVNGKMAKLLQVTGDAKKAEGNLEGRAELKQESKDLAG